MKTIDEIEKLSLEDLERISLDESIPVPSNLESKLSRRAPRWFIGIAASLLIIAGIGLSWFNRSKPLEDTFDDPAVAYAMLEKTLTKYSKEIVNMPSDVMRPVSIDNANK